MNTSSMMGEELKHLTFATFNREVLILQVESISDHKATGPIPKLVPDLDFLGKVQN